MKIIAFAGRKQSGKTSSAEFVQRHYNEVSILYNFADQLKRDVCMNIFGLTYHQCYGTDEEKNQLVNCWWPNGGGQMTARAVMQYVGTDVFRAIQTNVWANATLIKIRNECPSLAVIADCRFPNEVHAIKEAGGLVIKLARNMYNSDHASETALDADKFDEKYFDLVVQNQDMTLDEKNLVIKEFLQKAGVL